MILYRALHDEEVEIFNKTGMIFSTLEYSYYNIKENINPILKDYIVKKYNECFYNEENSQKKVRQEITSHVSLKSLKLKRSPWISATSDFEMALMYARKGNYSGDILCFEVCDDSIINTEEEYESMIFKEGTVLNLTKNRLSLYCKNGLASSYNQDLHRSINYSFSKCPLVFDEYLLLRCFKPNFENSILLSLYEQELLINKFGNKVQDYLEEKLLSKDKEVSKSLQLAKKMI